MECKSSRIDFCFLMCGEWFVWRCSYSYSYSELCGLFFLPWTGPVKESLNIIQENIQPQWNIPRDYPSATPSIAKRLPLSLLPFSLFQVLVLALLKFWYATHRQLK